MTRASTSENDAAMLKRRQGLRDFIRFTVRTRDTGAPVEDCYWSDDYPITAEVIDTETGSVVSLDFARGLGLISISDIQLVSTLTVQTVQIKLSQVSDRVNTLLRIYDCKQGRVEIWRCRMDLASRVMVGPALPRFVGTINQAPVTTPKENDPSGDVTLSCIDNTQELTRANPDTRSDASQRLRNPTDNCFADVVAAQTWEVNWGKNGGPVRTIAGGGLGLPGVAK